MSNHRLVLASRSPRRRELLESCGISFAVIESHFAEHPHEHELPQDYVVRNAVGKALKVSENCQWDAQNPTVFLGADTVVVNPDGLLLEKPKSPENARFMLESLSGKWHEVWTGFCLIDGEKNQVLIEERVLTRVKFIPLSAKLLEVYLNTGEPYDKAGGYGIQGLGAAFVEEIHGSYTNVVGLPLSHTLLALEKHSTVRPYQL